MDLEIRIADPKDAEIVALLGRITFRETFGHLFEHHQDYLRSYLDRTFAVEKIRRSLGNPRNRYWLAFLAGLPSAYAKLKFPSPTTPIASDQAGQLQKIYVLREFVGQGIGNPLLAAVLSHASSRKVEVVWLDVLKQNTRAVRFYQRAGFTLLGDHAYTIGSQTFSFHLMVFDSRSPAT